MMFQTTEKDLISKRFWPKVKKAAPNQCWLWRAGKSDGYGIFIIRDVYGLRYQPHSAHRVSYALTHGPNSLKPGLQIAHLCHNRNCVNPKHLLQCTCEENLAHSKKDKKGAWRKNRARGIDFKSAKINEGAVREIRKCAKDLDGECAMMLKYRISQIQVKAVYRRKYWAHVR